MIDSMSPSIRTAYLLNPPMVDGFVRGGRWQGVRARGRTMYYPIWLAYAAAALEDLGVIVKLRDAPAQGLSRNWVLKDVATISPDLVVVDTNFSTLSLDIQMINDIRTQLGKDAIIGITGPPCMTHHKSIIERARINFLIKGEVDFALKELIRSYNNEQLTLPNRYPVQSESGVRIVNAFDTQSDGEDLNQQSFVSSIYEKHLRIEDYFLDHTLWPEVQLISGRGCSYRCSFCSWPRNLTGSKVRLRSARHVVDELHNVSSRLSRVKEIFFEDDTFTISKKRTVEICDAIIKDELDVTWSCQARADVPLDVMQKMKRAGCRLLDVGFESASDKTLKSINKGITTDGSRTFVRNARKAGLMLLGDFMIGLPGEMKEDAIRTVEFARELDLDMVQFSIATPIPGTPFYDHCKENGYLITENLEDSLDCHGFQKAIVNYPEFNSGQMEDLVDEAIRSYYLSPRYILKMPRMLLSGNPLDEIKRVAHGGIGMMNYLLRKNTEQATKK